MKSSLVLISAVGLSLGMVACATSENHSFTDQTSNADRRIAQDSTIEYTTDKKDVNHVCGHAPDANVTLPADQLVLTSRMESVVRYTVHTPVYDCETTQGDGKSGDWAGFYDRAGDKAEMLAKAIKGVGKKTSPYLVPYFQKGKPRSWREFSDLITSAANDMKASAGMNPGWTNGVLYQYKMDNMQHLGYLGSTGCTITSYNDNTYEERTFIRDLSIVVESSVSGGKLLPGECETYSVSYDGRQVAGDVAGDFNQYTAVIDYDDATSDYNTHGRKVRVSFRGKRQQTTVGFLAEYNGSTVSGSGSSAQLLLRNATLHAMNQIPEFANACKVSATTLFYGKKGNGWFTKKSKSSKTVVTALNANADSTTITVDGLQLQPKEHAAAAVNIAVSAGCPFYNTESLEIGKFD